MCKTKQRGFRVKQFKHGLYKFNNFFGSPSLSHKNNFNKAKSEHGLLPGPELEMSKNWNSSSGRFLAIGDPYIDWRPLSTCGLFRWRPYMCRRFGYMCVAVLVCRRFDQLGSYHVDL